LKTVECYLANDLNIESTAQDLGVHVNTVRERLSRAEALTGHRLRETETIVEFWWALQRRRFE
jgi:carbohydrate diacid regulator